MLIRKSNPVIIVAAAFGIFTLGYLVVRHSVKAAPATEPRKAPKELLEKRRDAARNAYLMHKELLLVGRSAQPALLGWSERWLDAELALCEKQKDRIAAFKTHVDRTREVEQMARSQKASGRGTTADVNAASYERIDAEIRYFEATGKAPPLAPEFQLEMPKEALTPPQEEKRKK